MLVILNRAYIGCITQNLKPYTETKAFMFSLSTINISFYYVRSHMRGLYMKSKE